MLYMLGPHHVNRGNKKIKIVVPDVLLLYFISKIFTLKHLKRSYMFRSLDHPQTAHIVPC